jgi:hypothetical protein
MLETTFFQRYSLLFAGTAIGSWLGLRIQFGLHVSPYFSEELSLLGFALLGSLIVVTLLTPVSLFLQRTLSIHVVAAVASASVLVSIALGLWVYVGFLHRPLALVLERDWPYVLCFGLGGVGYTSAYALQRRV